jgi:hypothetical protein
LHSSYPEQIHRWSGLTRKAKSGPWDYCPSGSGREDSDSHPLSRSECWQAHGVKCKFMDVQDIDVQEVIEFRQKTLIMEINNA